MALLTRWGSINRVITHELTTNYARVPFGETGEKYWIYMRTRQKSYEYISMTKATALLCAKAMNELYNRRILEQEWYNGGAAAPNPNSCWRFITGSTAADRSYNPTNVFTQNVTTSAICGTASAQHESGDAWKVVVNVSERLSYNYRPLQCTDTGNPLPWSTFESDPTASHLEFYGCINGKNENYDTATTGYGSPS